MAGTARKSTGDPALLPGPLCALKAEQPHCEGLDFIAVATPPQDKRTKLGCAPGGIQTPNLPFAMGLLYSIELQALGASGDSIQRSGRCG